MDNSVIEQVVEAVLAELSRNGGVVVPEAPETHEPEERDITSEAERSAVLVKNPVDAEAIARMKKYTNARVGVGRAGARYNTQTLITLRADHAAARDAVFMDIDRELLDGIGLFAVESRCTTKDEFLTRPDLGRQLSDESVSVILEKCVKKPDIQIFAADGLSSTAIKANLPDLLPSLLDGLKNRSGISVGTPFFVKNGRVGLMDQVSELLEAKVTCVLIGERPGLATAESMSAYIAYEARVGMEESRRTVVSNIHRLGVPAVEAGAYLAGLLCSILKAKASGVGFRRDTGNEG
jgi:ethanolamine ammonia-lyase small subunit